MELSEPAPRPGARDFVRALPQASQIIVGLVSLGLAAACFIRFGLNGRAVVGATFVVVLVVLSAIDLDCRLIPNVILLPTLAVSLAAQIALYPDHTREWVFASLGAALFLFLPL